MTAKCSELLAHRATVVADWADRMPLRDVYIFGDHAGADVGAGAKLKIAIEYSVFGTLTPNPLRGVIRSCLV